MERRIVGPTHGRAPLRLGGTAGQRIRDRNEVSTVHQELSLKPRQNAQSGVVGQHLFNSSHHCHSVATACSTLKSGTSTSYTMYQKSGMLGSGSRQTSSCRAEGKRRLVIS